MLLHFGSVPVLVVSSPTAAREIMKTHDSIFSDRPKSSITDRLFYGSKDVAFAPYGEYWRQVRSICVLHLLSNKRVQVALGRKYCTEEHGQKDIMGLLEEYMKVLGVFDIGDYIPWLAWVNRINGFDRKVEKLAKELDEFIEGVVEEHSRVEKQEADGLDLVDILLQIQRENKIGFPIHRDTVKAIILDMFAAGTHTSYTVLEWTMAELIKNSKIMKNLQNEVRTKFKTYEDIETMQYLKAVIKETLRFHSPAPLLLPRKAIQDVKVMGFHVAAGTHVLVNSWGIGRDPTIWENSEEFKPERFLNSNVDYKGMHFELIPFGAGRRGCPGLVFGITTVELALATLIREFDFALGEGKLDMNEGIGITCHKKIPLVVIATPMVS
nr:cytochrome P450 71A2-like [Ipomoea batatas]